MAKFWVNPFPVLCTGRKMRLGVCYYNSHQAPGHAKKEKVKKPILSQRWIKITEPQIRKIFFYPGQPFADAHGFFPGAVLDRFKI